MKEDIYSKLPKLKVHLSFTALIASIVGIGLGFLLPIYLISNRNAQGEISTSSVFNFQSLNQSELLILLGSFILIVSITALLFMAIGARVKKRNKFYL